MATWLEDIKQVFEAVGGEVHYSDLYEELGRIRGRKLSRNDEATVRKEVERFSSDSDNWKEGRADLFRSARGKGKGFWSLADTSAEARRDAFGRIQYPGRHRSSCKARVCERNHFKELSSSSCSQGALQRPLPGLG